MVDYGINPFVSGLRIRGYVVRSGYVREDELLVDNEVVLDSGVCYKVYSGKGLYRLGHREMQVMLYVMHRVKSGDDWVLMDMGRCMSDCGIKSEKTYRESIKGLIREGYIARSVVDKNVFFINPAFLFKGSRIKKYPEKVSVVKKD